MNKERNMQRMKCVNELILPMPCHETKANSACHKTQKNNQQTKFPSISLSHGPVIIMTPNASKSKCAYNNHQTRCAPENLESFPSSVPIQGSLLSGSQTFDLERNALTISTSAKGDHVFANVKADLITDNLWTVLQDVLNKIIPVNIGTDVDQRNTGTTGFLFDDFGNVGLKDIWTATFERFLNNFGSKLIHTVACRMMKNDI